MPVEITFKIISNYGGKKRKEYRTEAASAQGSSVLRAFPRYARFLLPLPNPAATGLLSFLTERSIS